jgi:hypothetical protein
VSRVLQVPVPEPGQMVDVWRQRYVVVDIAQSPLPPDILTSGSWQGQHLVTLSSVEDDAMGEELQVIWEIEPGRQPLIRHLCLDLLASIHRSADVAADHTGGPALAGKTRRGTTARRYRGAPGADAPSCQRALPVRRGQESYGRRDGQALAVADHALRDGDSLLGVNERRLYNWSMDAKAGEVRQMVWI